MSFKDYSGSTTYWSTLSLEILGLVFNEWVAQIIFKDFAPGNEDVVWLQKHPILGCGVGLVYHESNTKEFKVLVCKMSSLPALKEMHTAYNKILTDYGFAMKILETNPDLFEETLKIICDRLTMLIALGSVQGTSTEGNKQGDMSVGQFIDKLYPNKTAPFRLKGPVPDMPGGGTPSVAHVALELESRYMRDKGDLPKNASSADVDSWEKIKQKEKAAKLDSRFANTQMKLNNHFGRD